MWAASFFVAFVLVCRRDWVYASSSSSPGSLSLRTKIETEPLPIFQFAREMDSLLISEFGESGNNDAVDSSHLKVLEFETLFYEYTAKLRDFYVLRFLKEIEEFGGAIDGQALAERKAFCVKECRIAMLASVPRHPMCVSWSFSGQLAELHEDIELIIRDRAEVKTAIATDGKSVDRGDLQTRPSRLTLADRAKTIWRNHKWARWLLSQSALLLVNYAQSEYVRIIVTAKHTQGRN